MRRNPLENVVVTAHDVSSKERRQLKGYVDTILQKKGDSNTKLLNRVRTLLDPGRWGGVQEIAQTPELHDYQIFDVRAGLQTGGWEVSVYSNNAGQESYSVFEGPTTRRWNIPRTYGAQLRYSW